VEILKDIRIDWLKNKWYFLGVSGLLVLIGVVGYLARGFAYGIDFTGGTIIYVKFSQKPNLDAIRDALNPESVGTTVIQTYDEPAKNIVLVRMQTVFGSGQDVDAGQKAVQALLWKAFGSDSVRTSRQKIDPASATPEMITSHLVQSDPDNLRSRNKPAEEITAHYQAVATALMNYRDKAGPKWLDALDPKVLNANPAVIDSIQRLFYKVDFNSAGLDQLASYLIAADPDKLKSQNKTTAEIESFYRNLTFSMIDHRNKVRDGLIPSLDEMAQVPGVSAATVESLKTAYFTGPFAIKGVESVGAIVGADLRRRAALAVGLSVVAMLVYIGFRFKPIYGVAAIAALFHDVIITLGLFALSQKEISLTVVGALLTLVGYSVNDKIVIFDRVRENLRLNRKDSLTRIINLSINQTLSRTILTSGIVFCALALWVFGGEVLNGFAFALTVGIIVGTYSTFAIAGPIVEVWYRSQEQKSGRKAA
jgi:preprotein translocase SecF subunit